MRRLAAEKMLRAGAWIWQWRDAASSEVSASISIYGGSNALRLSYRVNGNEAAQSVAIERTACGYGGSRPWFCCPCCGRRAAKLFLLRGRFACRHCHQLTYASRCEDDVGRAWRKQSKLERKLGANWQRPRYMHHATRERILAAIWACEERREVALAHAFAALLGG